TATPLSPAPFSLRSSLPLLSPFFLSSCSDHPDLHSFPTRRSSDLAPQGLLDGVGRREHVAHVGVLRLGQRRRHTDGHDVGLTQRSEEHTSELQSPDHLVCRLLLEKKKQIQRQVRNQDGT